MREAAKTEFWRDLKPIANVFKPGALPEVYLADAPTDDEGPLQRDWAGRVARREWRARGPVRRLRLHRDVQGALREGRHRSRLRRLAHALNDRRHRHDPT